MTSRLLHIILLWLWRKLANLQPCTRFVLFAPCSLSLPTCLLAWLPYLLDCLRLPATCENLRFLGIRNQLTSHETCKSLQPPSDKGVSLTSHLWYQLCGGSFASQFGCRNSLDFIASLSLCHLPASGGAWVVVSCIFCWYFKRISDQF
jgi:hypothetical protein